LVVHHGQQFTANTPADINAALKTMIQQSFVTTYIMK
jgi:hypothetical protein